MSIETAVTTNMIATFLMVFAYAYLYLQYRHKYLAKWVLAWVLHAIRIFFLERPFIAQSSEYATILYLGFSFAYSLLLVEGAVEFAGKRISKLLLMAGVVAVFFSIGGVLIGANFHFYGLPAVIFIGITYIYTGFIFRDIGVRGLGNSLTAGAFILLGIHTLDMPFLLPIKWFAPWGYLMDALLRCLVAFGIIFIYFEKVRNDLANQEKYYRLLTENATDVIYRYRLTGAMGFEYISPAVKMLTGYEAGDLKSIRDVLRIIHPEDRRKIKGIIRTLSNNDGFVSFRLRQKTGDFVWAEQKSSLFFDPEGRPSTVDGIVRDVTKRVLLEQDVARLDRLNIAGQMAANLAHEVRNPLTTVRGYLQLMGSRQEFHHFKDQFFMLLGELDRTNGIITEYLSLSKDKLVDIRRRSLNDIIQALYPLIQTDAVVSKIEVRLSLAKTPELYLDDKEIKQLLLNLTRNAIEAMPDGGLLEIATSSAGGEVILTVSDQGSGIPQVILQNLGKPFLTTKGGGTGLGMAICYRIAGRHNAKLDIETGQAGTTISIRFRKQ